MRIVFIGDVAIGGEFIQSARKHEIDIISPFRNIMAYVKGVDVLVYNLEGPIFKSGTNHHQGKTIVTDNQEVLKLLGEHEMLSGEPR